LLIHRAAAEDDGGIGGGEILLEVGMGGDALRKVFRKKAAGGQGVVDGAEALEGERSQGLLHRVPHHERAGKDGRGEGHAGDDCQIREAEVEEGAGEEFDAGHAVGA
jgi:hypothetical protein